MPDNLCLSTYFPKKCDKQKKEKRKCELVSEHFLKCERVSLTSWLFVDNVQQEQHLAMSSGDFFNLTFKLKLKSFFYILVCFEYCLIVIHESPTSRLWIL